MKKYLRLMRVHHYIKNFLIFAPLIFSGLLFDARRLISTVVGFLAFCLLTSAVYVVNDIFDAESDRSHPTKCSRPIACGDISVKNAWAFAVFLFLLGVLLHYLSGFDVLGSVYVLLYLVFNFFYSFGLKNIPIADIAILVSGFLLRVMYGSAVSGIEVSEWLYLTVISISFYFALGKRRNELARHGGGGSTRKVLKFYTRPFLDKNMYMCLALANVFYALWGMAHHNKLLIWTVPVVILICMKYSLDVEGD
jgi:decaprenyl-phosphate phosphoribosyltransferase